MEEGSDHTHSIELQGREHDHWVDTSVKMQQNVYRTRPERNVKADHQGKEVGLISRSSIEACHRFHAMQIAHRGKGAGGMILM